MICSTATYRHLMKDDASLDEDIYEALTEAQKVVERKTNREFNLRDEAGLIIERQETCKIHRNWLVYPRATPVVKVLEPTSARIHGNAISGTIISTSTPWWRFPWTYLVSTVKYNGGYEPEDMPVEIVRAVAEMAHAYLTRHIIKESTPPLGATAMHVGDVSVSLNPDWSVALMPPHINGLLREWRRREV